LQGQGSCLPVGDLFFKKGVNRDCLPDGRQERELIREIHFYKKTLFRSLKIPVEKEIFSNLCNLLENRLALLDNISYLTG